MALPQILRAENDLLFDNQGGRLIDLFSANGTTFLGHCNPVITGALTQQMKQVWITGGLSSPIWAEARALVESYFPQSHGLAGFYSTGMEAAEFAIRIGRGVSGRTGVAGFEMGMHGKSMATAYLSWNNDDNLHLPCLHRLPFVHNSTEERVLDRLEQALRDKQIGTVFVEPVHGSGGGHAPSKDFHNQLLRLCHEQGVVVVFDEILTGFHRTGVPFRFLDLADLPDLILVGKAMGNGFPVSAVVARRDITIGQKMLPGSTFANNALAASAVAATLKLMEGMDVPAAVAAIERVIVNHLQPLREQGIALRGQGAMWILEAKLATDIEAAVTRMYRRGVFMSYAGRFLRILPAATIDLDNLARGCQIVREELQRAASA